MEAPVRDSVIIDGKVITITKLPPAPVNADLHFDRWSHDDAAHSPELSRSQALPFKNNWQSGSNPLVMGKNGRVRPKRQR